MPPIIKPTKQGETARRMEEKSRQILDVLNMSEIDLWKLRGLAITEGGLVNDDLRRKAWPKLVGIHERYWVDDDGTANCNGPRHGNVRHTSDASTVNTDATPKKSNVVHHVSAVHLVENRINTERSPPASRERSCSPESEDCVSSVTSANSLRDKVLASSLDFQQIELDVARCTWHLLTGTQRLQRLQMEYKRNRKVASLIRRKQRRLANLINLTLVKSYKQLRLLRNDSSSPTFDRDNTLRYYQGYHDVACIILSTVSGSAPVRLPLQMISSSSSLDKIAKASGLDLPASVLLQLSQSHFRDCMRANFAQLQATMRLTLLPMIAYFDLTLHDFLADCSMEPFFALSWIITWFSHDVRDTDLTKRLFDFFISSHPLMPFYVSVAMVCHPLNRQDVLQTECDFALVHQTLSALPRNSSMVGWKYQPGDGYVSDDEQSINDDDESFASQNSVDTEFILHEQVIQTVYEHEKIGAEAVSIVSSSMSTCYDARVPFQEIFELALVYIERLPPRNLLRLARRYFGKEFVENLSQQAPGIFIKPPDWTTCPTAKNDMELRREPVATCQNEQGLHLQRFVDAPIRVDPQHRATTFLDPLKQSAVVAAGISLRDDDQRRKKRARQLLFGGAVAVGIIAFYWIYIDGSPLPVAPNVDLELNRTVGMPKHIRDEIDNGQTILAASFCWDTTEKDTIDKEYLFTKSVVREETALALIESAHIPHDSTRGLQSFDRIVSDITKGMLRETLELGHIIKTESMLTVADRLSHLALYIRNVVLSVFERLQFLKVIDELLRPQISKMPSSKEKQALLPSTGDSRNYDVPIQPRLAKKPPAISDTRGLCDITTTTEGGLSVLFQIVTNACFGHGPCRNFFELPRKFNAIKKFVVRAKNTPGKTIGNVMGRMTPIVAAAIDGASLADHYSNSPASTGRCAENRHCEDKEGSLAS